MIDTLVRSFITAAQGPEDELAPAALLIARIEYPRLDASTYLDELDRLGERARLWVRQAQDAGPRNRIAALSAYLFDEQGFAGNREQFEDPRNSFLHQVLERRRGIPISLAVLYIEIARRAGLRVQGVNFPGHFLMRYADDRRGPFGDYLIVDPFNEGALLSELDCLALLRAHAGDDAELDPSLLAPARKRDILFRMLGNLKRIYVKQRSFPQARQATSLMLALQPDSPADLRDRGLISYHLRDYSTALQDLERYLQLSQPASGSDDREELDQIWEHVKTLRRRIASFN